LVSELFTSFFTNSSSFDDEIDAYENSLTVGILFAKLIGDFMVFEKSDI
jgi:hypothetical protein